jgi:hypothetical protein
MSRLAAPFLAAVFALPSAGGEPPRPESRAPAKEPTYGRPPRYCRLEFGASPPLAIWLALDAPPVGRGGPGWPDETWDFGRRARALYIDRKADGDLTAPEGRVAADPDTAVIDEREYTVGDLTNSDGRRRYAGLRVSHSGSEVGARGFGFPESFRVSVRVRGQLYSASLRRLGATPRTAPVVRFDAPPTFVLAEPDRQVFKAGGEPGELRVLLGIPGAGDPPPLTVPARDRLPDRGPVADIAFPARGNGPQVRTRVALEKECCGRQGYAAPVRVPDEAGPGVATVVVSFPGWSDGPVAPATLRVQVVSPAKE